MLQLQWTIEGQTQLSRVLRNIGSEIKDWTPAFGDAAKELVKVFSNDVFSTRGAAIGESWAPLKPRYLAQKARAGFSTEPLVKTGAMQKSFKSMFKADYAEVWNSAVYFKYHQSNAPRKVLPRRVMMKLGENQKQMIVKIFHSYWQKKIKSSM